MKMNGETGRGRHILIDHPWSDLGIEKTSLSGNLRIADRFAFVCTSPRSTWAIKVAVYSIQKVSGHAAAMLRCIVQFDGKEPAHAIR
jgi:hypothetical protein